MTRSLHIAFLVLVVVVVAAFTLNSLILQSKEVGPSLQFLHDRSQLITTTALRIIQLQNKIHEEIVRYRQEEDPRLLEERHRDDREVGRLSEELKHRLDTNTGHDLLAGYQASRERLARLEEQFIEAARTEREDDQERILGKIEAERRAGTSYLHSLLGNSNEVLCSRISEIERDQKTLQRTLIMRTVTLGFVLCLLLAITWSILGPLHQLTEAANRMADGDLSVSVDVKSRYGEIRQLATDFEKMRERVRENHAMLELRIAQRTLDLRKSQERLELAVSGDEAGLWDWEPQAKRVTCNRSWATLLGYEENELKRDEEAFFGQIHPDDAAAVRARFEDHLSGGAGSYESTHRLRRKNGDWLWVLDRGRVVERDAQGKPIRVVGLVHNVTNRQRTQEQLDVSSRELDARTTDLEATRHELARKDGELKQVVRAVSDDLRSPLATVKRLLGDLKEAVRLGKHDRVADSVEKIETPANHAYRLIDALVELSEVDAALRSEPVDVSSVVRELRLRLQPRLDDADITLEIQDDLPTVMADRTALSKVFEELLSNAIRYGRGSSPSKMTIGSVSLDDEVRFFVKDHGPGIPAENHNKVFELFARLGEGDEDGGNGLEPGTAPGTGAGLAIVAKIMQAHRGRAWVESSAGKGATFWLSFQPVSDSVAAQAGREPVPA